MRASDLLQRLLSFCKKDCRSFFRRKVHEMLPCLIVDPIEWDRNLPNLYITEMIMPDEIDLDTDEDRIGTVKEDEKTVKRIDTLGGTPDCLEIVDESTWAQFLPPSRPAIEF
uniref:AGC-kinase C-terminal domain-containing protein n=1 Tax=Ascaris lumbricoides TaxID=6252 RepID=A0A0M3HSG5_ASCLU